MLESAGRPVIKSATPQREGTNGRSWLWIAALLCGLTGLHLWSLLRFPQPFVDEGWYASRAWGLLHSGWAYGSVDEGGFENFPHYERFFFWLGSALTAPAIALRGC